MERFAPKLTPCTSKKQKREFDAQDRISELPDEVLIFILSLMPIKVAAKTSVLSLRWKRLWTFIPRLEFDASNTLLKIKHQIMGFRKDRPRVKKILDLQRVWYVNWVNHFVESYPLPAIDEFKVCFDLNESYKPDIDKWVRFAFEKNSKRIELDFSNLLGFLHIKGSFYTLCPLTLGLPSSISLTSLILKQVNVSGEVLDNFISNSPFLECLCVQSSRSLVHLRVAGPSPHLKYLEIYNCGSMKSLKLHAANLLSLKYSGPKIKIPFRNVPNLTELCIGGPYLLRFTRKLPQISTFVSQLQKLVLRIGFMKKKLKRLEYPLMIHLKQLEMSVFANDYDSLLFLSSWIKACPFLNRFAMELIWIEPRFQRKVEKARKSPHPSLKVVEMTGFVGKTVDTELCMFLIENAILLEKIIIDPCISRYENFNAKRVDAARECAELLKSKYSLGDKLEFRR